MSYLQISGLKISYGDKVVLHNIDLAVEQGEMIALLGPSGCGKTTLLNALCGFIPVQSGEVAIASRTITHLAPEQRNITMVFQSYALWPHLTVARNIGYGLKLRKWRGADIARRVAELLRIVNLEGLGEVKVTELSGGQRQRVALARALAIEPQVLVLDEPLSNLDAKLRVQMRSEIIKLHERIGATTIYVTHDQTEAMTMASRIVVMKDGYIQQIGAPKEIYEHPANMFVAGFLGSPAMNFIEGTYKEGMFCFDAHSIEVNDLAKESLKTYENKRIIMGIRPENIYMEEIVAQTYPKSVIDYQLDVKELLGNEYILHGTIGNTPMVAKVNARMELQPHQMLKLTIDANRMNFFDPETEEAIHS